MATFQFTINGTDYSQYVVQDSWDVVQEFGRTAATMSIQLLDERNSGTYNFLIPAMCTVQLKNTVTNQILFAGLCLAPKAAVDSREILWTLSCTDYTIFADRIIVNGTYTNMTAYAVLADLANKYPCGIIISPSFCQTGPVLTRVHLVNRTYTEAIKKICDLAGVAGNFQYFIDENRYLHFYDAFTVTSNGITLTDNVSGNSTSTTAYYNNLSYDYDASKLYNSVIVQGTNHRGVQKDMFRADGVTSTWFLKYPVDTSLQYSLKVNHLAETIAQGDPANPATTNYVLNNNSGSWSFSANMVYTPPIGSLIEISYHYFIPVSARKDDTASQVTFSNPYNHGVYQTYVKDKQLVDLGSAIGRAQTEMREFAHIAETITLSTTEDWANKGVLRAGQIFHFICSNAIDIRNGNAIGVNGYFLIRSLAMKASHNYLVFDITAVRVS